MSDSAGFCGPYGWGPQLNSTDRVDFTPCFEDTIILLSPSAFIIIFGIMRLLWLHFKIPRSSMATSSTLFLTKMLGSIAMAILALADLSKIAHDRHASNSLVYDYQILFVVISFIAFALVPIILWGEHSRLQASSTTLTLFWLFWLLTGVVKFRTLVLDAQDGTQDTFRFTIFMMQYAIGMVVLGCASWPEPTGLYKSLDEDANPCPEQHASVFSLMTFSWITSLVALGHKRALEQDDLWSLNPQEKSPVLAEQFEEAWNKEKSKPKPSVYFALVRAYGWTFFNAAFFKLIQDSLNFVQPVLLNRMINYVQDTNEPNWHGYAYAGGLFCTAVIQSLMLHQYFHRTMRVGMRVRSGLTAAIYRKALLLSNSSRQASTVGEIVNLMSVDSQRFQDLTTYFHMIWSAPFQICLSLYFLYQVMGPATFSGLGVMILMIPLNTLIATKSRTLQKKQMVNKDSRIKLMSEILAGIKVLKLYAWEHSFMDMVNAIRNRELQVLKSASYLNALAAFAWSCAPFIVSLATFVTYTLSGNDLTAEKAFVALALFNILQFPLSMLPFLLSSMVEASVSNKRIKNFLLQPELKPENVLRELPADEPRTRDISLAFASRDGVDAPPVKRNVRVLIKNGSFKWSEDSAILALDNIEFDAVDATITAIVGRVGSGKSSLVSALLGDMEKVTGEVYVLGSVAYVPQQAWIQNATLRDNILFGKQFVQEKYDKVIQACALKPDIEMLPGGDLTEIGEKGINLSGGQKQRVSLARAVYQDCDVYIFDDPLSAVDAHVGKHIFDQVLSARSVLKEKTRILVTHSVRFLPQMDKIVVMKDGLISESGTYNQLKIAGKEFSKFLAEYAAEAEREQSSNEAAEEEKLKQSEKESASENVKPGNESILFSGETTEKSKKTEDAVPAISKGKSAVVNASFGGDRSALVQKETSETGSVKASVYMDYVRAIGSNFTIAIVLGYIVGQGTQIGSNIWLSFWSDKADEDPEGTKDDNSKYLGVYAALGLGNAVFVLLSTFIQALGSIHASELLHSKMLKNTMRSPMSFFDTTPMGRIVNRFSKDIYVIDETIPSSLRSFLGTFFRVISCVVVIAYSTPYFLIAVVPLGLIYVKIYQYYVSTSRQLKRLDSVSRSPIYAHFSETLTGVSSIRAYRQQHRFLDENMHKVDDNQIAYYPTIASNRWLAVRLEIIGSLVVLLSALLAVFERDSIGAGVVGLSISYALSITQSLNWMVRMSSDLETNIVAVERVKEYIETPTEAPEYVSTSRKPAGWPTHGQIEFRNYSVRYREGLDLVLRGIDVQIRSGEKVGICGRTGAGKSSLTLSLFRIIEAAGGSIVIDGVDIGTLGLHDLRSKINIIPQDPVLFSGTVRSNLDPLQQHGDASLWEALERSHLKKVVSALELKLNAPVQEGGDNFSVGQRQLICLARALLRKTRILVLDEATSALDVESDALIQETIRTEFSDCTVLTIAHRLNTIIDSDRILVLDNGRIAEFDTPQVLLADSNGVFANMAKAEGLHNTN